MDGFINLYKPKDFTSHDALNIIRRNFRGTKIGHGGTLDPDATGVLPVCLGKATKLQDYIMGQQKAYEADIIFGLDSLSLDMSGEVTVTEAHFPLDETKLQTVLKGFLGEQQQLPPVVSAIKHHGVPGYKLARQGKAVEVTPRQITITELRLLAAYPEEEFPRIRIAVQCSKGTYIRSLGRDIGKALGTTAVIDHLVRTKSGFFTADNAYTLEEIAAFCEKKDYSFILPMEAGVKDFPIYGVTTGEEWKALCDGGEFKANTDIKGSVALFDALGNLMALGESSGDVIKVKKKLWERRDAKKTMITAEGLPKAASDRDCLMIIGNFDGVHLGHQYLLTQGVRAAEAQGLLAVVMTFAPHPRVFFGGVGRNYLQSSEEKQESIAATGVDMLLTVAFDRKFASLSQEAFVFDLLQAKLRVKEIWVGEDFTFGSEGKGNAASLTVLAKAAGIKVCVLPKLTLGGKAISSTRIKAALAKGDIPRVRQLLGRAYTIKGEVVHGHELGRTIGFPTANLCFDAEICIPENGVYLALAVYDGKTHEAVANIGSRPTVNDDRQMNLEVHVLDDAPLLYGKIIKVTLLFKIRNEKKYASLTELKAAIGEDVVKAKNYFEKRRNNPCNLK